MLDHTGVVELFGGHHMLELNKLIVAMEKSEFEIKATGSRVLGCHKTELPQDYDFMTVDRPLVGKVLKLWGFRPHPKGCHKAAYEDGVLVRENGVWERKITGYDSEGRADHIIVHMQVVRPEYWEAKKMWVKLLHHGGVCRELKKSVRLDMWRAFKQALVCQHGLDHRRYEKVVTALGN